MKTIEIIQPDDWHVHFRDGEVLKNIAPYTANLFGRAIIMPNLVPPITNRNMCSQYKDEIISKIRNFTDFEPCMTIYLTETINIKDLIQGYKYKEIFAVKLYPSGATTNSKYGINNFKNISPVLEAMEKNDIPLLVHGEISDSEIDVFDREKYFLENILNPLIKQFPNLRITMEHITTKESVQYIKNCTNNIKATITLHHLCNNRNDMLGNGIKPHLYCMPILKRADHQKKLIEAALSGSEKFFYGSDSAPHFKKDKESSCGCAGIFNTINSIQTLAQIFDTYDSLSNLESFVSKNGALHYKLPFNKKKIKLIKKNNYLKFPKTVKINNEEIVVFKPDFRVYWDFYAKT